MKAACIVLTILIIVAIMAVCVMVKFATDITVDEKKRELTMNDGVFKYRRMMGVFTLTDNTSIDLAQRFPYVAAITRKKSSTWAFGCFASIILVKWVLTSAHCKLPGVTNTVLLYHDFARNYTHSYPILLWHIHARFNLSSPSAKYDIAVAKLTLDQYPIMVKSSLINNSPPTELEAAIWKTVSTMDRKIYLTNDMGKKIVKVAMFGRCFESYGVDVDDSLICIDLSDHEDCFTNEFGPIYSGDKVVGILAVKPRDCDMKLAIFTNVSYYANWVLKSTHTTYYG